MTREIKFRAWDKDTQQGMFYGGFSIHATGRIKRDMFNEDNLIIMQYTGLKDKNGVEIYEGDILGDESGIIIIQEMNNGNFTYTTNQGAGGIFPFDCEYKNMEVIGNIYQNPELLK